MELLNIDRCELLNILKNTNISYRKKLNFDSDIKFGVEIEYGNAPREKLIKVANKFMVDKSNLYYGKWRFTNDLDFTYIVDDKIFGGEVKTPVFNNDEKYFKELYIMCKKLKKYNAVIDDRMALHVHVSKDATLKNPEKFLNFLKLYTVYEHIIYKFGYCGDTPRDAIYKYAIPIRKILLNFLKSYKGHLNYSSLSTLIENLFCDILLDKKYGLNLGNISFYDIFNDLNTIEFRMCNGTIDPIIIQNEINLFCSIISSLESDNIDIDFLDYKINNMSLDNFDLSEYGKIYIDDALKFTDTVFKEDVDKKYFLKQYIM